MAAETVDANKERGSRQDEVNKQVCQVRVNQADGDESVNRAWFVAKAKVTALGVER